MSATLEENKKDIKNGCSSLKSSESLYSASSLNSRLRSLQRKSRSVTSSTGNNIDIRQRVLSARLNRFKTLQNQLSDALQQNAALCNENRLLKTLHKRQDTALAKYEGSHAELPQLLSSHTEELRIWQYKSKKLLVQNRELSKRILTKDKTINDLNDRLKHLTLLISEKNLEERSMLTHKIKSLELQIAAKDEEQRMLSRRNHLEAKNFKTQISNEKQKYKALRQRLEQLTNKQQIDSEHSSAKEKLPTTSKSIVPKFMNPSRQSSIESNLDNENSTSIFLNENVRNISQTMVSDDEDDEDLIIRTLFDKKTESGELQQMANKFSDLRLLADEIMPNIGEIQDHLQNDIDVNEKLLDKHCDEISRDFDILSPSQTIAENESVTTKDMGSMTKLPTFNSQIDNRNRKRPPIDPQKKSKLLAALKSIDSSSERI